MWLLRARRQGDDASADHDRHQDVGRDPDLQPARWPLHAPAQIRRDGGFRLPLAAPRFQFGIKTHFRFSNDSRNSWRARVKRAPPLLSEMPSTSAISAYPISSSASMMTWR